MPRIEILIQRRRARLASSGKYVCGNSDYIAAFAFDEEWDGVPIKTARFQQGDRYTDVVFEGTECPVPTFDDGSSMEIGVYAGANVETAVLYATTPAHVTMKKSIRSRGGEPQTPGVPGVFDQVVTLLNETAATTLSARDGASAAAGDAADSAAHAADSAGEAADFAGAAAGYAADLQAALDSALVFAQASETAKNDSMDAREKALQAKSEAETAQAAAEAALAEAVEAQVGAEDALMGAAQAQSQADVSRAAAELAKTAAESALSQVNTARSGAETAKSQAVSAKNQAETARQNAVNANTSAQAAKTSAEAAAAEAVNALAASMKTSVYDPQGHREDVFAYVDSRVGRKIYGILWDKVNAQCTRLFDAAGIPTDTSSYGHFGAVNPQYDNPFDGIYPWNGRRLCNYSIPMLASLVTEGYDVRDAVVAWEGEDGFTCAPAAGIGVGVYTPRFWHTSYDTEEGRVFAISGSQILGWTEAEPTIGGRWFGVQESVKVGSSYKSVLVSKPGVPATSIAQSTLHTYANNGGMTLEDIYSYDATTMLYLVEYANMDCQSAIGRGCDALYYQGSGKILKTAGSTNVVQVAKNKGETYCIVGALIDIGTMIGGNQIAHRMITAVAPDADNASALNLTLSGQPISVTTGHYWSVSGCGNREDAEIGSCSGYIGTNSYCNAYYRGQVMHGNMLRYLLGVYRQTGTGHIWIAQNRVQAETCDGLDTAVHVDTGIALPQQSYGSTSGYIQTLAAAEGLSAPPFCSANGGTSSAPVGDFCTVPSASFQNSIARVGGHTDGLQAGRFTAYWDKDASANSWNTTAIPYSKSARRNV